LASDADPEAAHGAAHPGVDPGSSPTGTDDNRGTAAAAEPSELDLLRQENRELRGDLRRLSTSLTQRYERAEGADPGLAGAGPGADGDADLDAIAEEAGIPRAGLERIIGAVSSRILPRQQQLLDAYDAARNFREDLFRSYPELKTKSVLVRAVIADYANNPRLHQGRGVFESLDEIARLSFEQLGRPLPKRQGEEGARDVEIRTAAAPQSAHVASGGTTGAAARTTRPTTPTKTAPEGAAAVDAWISTNAARQAEASGEARRPGGSMKKVRT
jgi:hypothetical protein